jgi:hypothetical protein
MRHVTVICDKTNIKRRIAHLIRVLLISASHRKQKGVEQLEASFRTVVCVARRLRQKT